MRAGEANLRERVRAMDFSMLGLRLGRCTAPPACGCPEWFDVDAIFVGFNAFGLKLMLYWGGFDAFGLKLMLYLWALRHLV